MVAGHIIPVVPRSRKDIEAKVNGFLSQHFPQHIEQPGQLPVLQIFERLHHYTGFNGYVEEMPTGDLGRTDFQAKDVVLSLETYEALERDEPRARFTTMHEVAHCILHADEMEIISASKKGVAMHRSDTSLVPIYRNPEWQANAAAAALLMPERALRHLLATPSKLFKSPALRAAATFGASAESARYRLENINR